MQQDNWDVAAAEILGQLDESGAVEFVTRRGAQTLSSSLSVLLLRLPRDDERAPAVADWLIDQKEVADLFIANDDLEALLRRHWDPVVQRAARRERQAESWNLRNPELEARLLEDPDNEELHLVYADWLQERGDPLGELIALQAAARRDPTAERQLAVEQHLRKHQAYLLGALAECRSVLQLDWHLGFLRKARLARAPRARHVYEGKVLLGWLLQLPIARLLRELELGLLDSVYGGSQQHGEMVRFLLAAPRPTLRSVDIDFSHRWSIGADIEEIANLVDTLPGLRRLAVRAVRTRLAALDHPHLEELTLHIGYATPANLAALGSARWPALRSLRLALLGYQVTRRDITHLGPLLQAKSVPRLRHLALRIQSAPPRPLEGDELVQLLLDAPLLRQLEELDLSRAALGDAGVALLAANADRVAHLRLELSDDEWLTPGEANGGGEPADEDGDGEDGAGDDEEVEGDDDEVEDDEDDEEDEDDRYDQIME
jgi:uncharacterized protein (TIGR02996 family)